MSTSASSTSKLTVEASEAPTGSMGQKLLISGNAMALRLWDEAPEDGQQKSTAARNYETLGYVLEGKAELTIEGKTVVLEPGISWAVPEGKEHTYKIIEPFRAVEATHPSARGDG
ncbi:MAG: cupin domain-containing protein [Cyanobacteria bacterium J06581_3]